MMKALKKSGNHIFLMAYLLIILFPFLFVVFSSLKMNNAEIALSPFGLPKQFHWENYVDAWINAKINVYFFNSLYISILSSCLTIVISSMIGFAVTRMRYNKISAILYSVVLLGMLIPNTSLMLPIYLLLQKIGVLNTHLALIIPYVANAIPLSTIIIAAFMRSLPGEIEEAAVIDGLSAKGIFAKIAMPLIGPALVTVFIISFLGNWNEFLLANYFLSDDALRTLPVGMVQFRDAKLSNYAQMSAGIVFCVVPVMVIYSVLQKQIIEGVTAGSVKG